MQLNIAELRTRHSVVKCIADPDKNGGTFDERVHDGLAWLVDAVQADVAALNERVKRDTLAAKVRPWRLPSQRWLGTGAPALPHPRPTPNAHSPRLLRCCCRRRVTPVAVRKRRSTRCT